MLSVSNVSPNFGSTKITVKPEEMKQNIFKVTDKYLGPVKKHYDTRAALENLNGKPVTSQMVADDLRLGEAGVKIDYNVISVYGKTKESDSFIGKLLTNLFPDNAKFTEDIK